MVLCRKWIEGFTVGIPSYFNTAAVEASPVFPYLLSQAKPCFCTPKLAPGGLLYVYNTHQIQQRSAKY